MDHAFLNKSLENQSHKWRSATGKDYSWESFLEVLRHRYNSLVLSYSRWNFSTQDLFISPVLTCNILFDQCKVRKETVRLKEIIENNNSTKIGPRILIIGDSGYGKTTLACKLAKDWACKKSYIQRKFLAVFLISLKEVNSSIEDEIDKQFEQKPSQFLDMLQDEILLILDGYDKLSSDNEKYVLPILHKKKFPAMTVIVTSRLEKRIHFPSWDNCLYIDGVQEDQKELFLKRHLGKKNGHFHRNSLEDLLNLNIQKLPENPFYFFSLVSLASQEELPYLKTKTNLFTKCLERAVKINLSRTSTEHSYIDLINQFDKAPFYVELLQHFGKFYIRNQNKRIFTRTEILKACDNDERIFSLGVLSIELKTESHLLVEQYIPRDHIFAQFCAAYYLWGLYKKAGNEFETEIKFMYDIHVVPSSQDLIFPILAGFLGEDTFNLLKILSQWASHFTATSADENMADKFTPIFNILNECQLSDKILNSIMNFLPSTWTILQEDNFYTSSLHSRLLDFGLSSHVITGLIWNTDVPVTFPSKINISEVKIIVLRHMQKLSSLLAAIQCKQLILEFPDLNAEHLLCIPKLINDLTCVSMKILVKQHFISVFERELKKYFIKKHVVVSELSGSVIPRTKFHQTASVLQLRVSKKKNQLRQIFR